MHEKHVETKSQGSQDYKNHSHYEILRVDRRFIALSEYEMGLNDEYDSHKTEQGQHQSNFFERSLSIINSTR